MIVGIVGSRKIKDFKIVLKAIDAAPFKINKIVSGGAVGVDSLAKQYALLNNIDYQEFKPEYDKYPSKIAPLLRNQTIIDSIEALIAVRLAGKSNGTDDAIRRAKLKNIPIFIYLVENVLQ